MCVIRKMESMGVLDTDDAICEYYTKSELLNISRSTNIQGVSGNEIRVLSSDYINAKAKLAGVKIKNTDWIKRDSVYRISDISRTLDCDDIILSEDGTDNILLTKEYCDLFVRKLKILNLLNNKSFTKDSVDVDDYMVVYDGNLYSLENFIKKLNSDISFVATYGVSLKSKFSNGYIEEVYRLDSNTIVVKYFINSVGTEFFRVKLDTGIFKTINFKDEYDFKNFARGLKDYSICECTRTGDIRKQTVRFKGMFTNCTI